MEFHIPISLVLLGIPTPTGPCGWARGLLCSAVPTPRLLPLLLRLPKKMKDTLLDVNFR